MSCGSISTRMMARRLQVIGVILLSGCSSSVEAPTLSTPDTGDTTPETGTGGDDAASSDADDDAPTPPEEPATQGVFVAVGYGGRTMRSLDGGLTWVDDQQLVESGGDDEWLLRSVTYGGGQFVAVGWRLMTSTDGKTWTDYGKGNFGNWMGSVRYRDNQFLGVGGYGLRVTSADGLTWSNEHIDTAATHPDDALACSVTACVSASDAGKRSYTSTGADWKYSESLSDVASYHVAFGASVFVAVGPSAILSSTDDGVTWQSTRSLDAEAGGVVFADDHFVVTQDGNAITSSDGLQWTDNVSNGVARRLAYGDGVYLMTGWRSIRRSTDGITWGSWQSTGAANSPSTITYGAIPVP